MSTDADKIKTLEEEIQNQKEYIEMLEEESETLKQEIEKLKSSKGGTVSKQNDDQVETLKAQNQELKDEIEFTKSEFQEEIQRLKAEIKGQEQAQLHQEQLHKQIEEYRIQIQNLQQKNSDKDDNHQLALQEQISQLQEELQNLRNQNENLQNENEILKVKDLELQSKNVELSDNEDKESENNLELLELQNQINDYQRQLQEAKNQLQNLQVENQTLKNDCIQLKDLNEKQQLEIEQKNLELNDEQSKIEQLENELKKFEENYQEVIQTKEQLSEENQQNLEKMREFDKLVSDNAELQILLNEKLEELNSLKLTNPYEKLYLELQEDYENFKQYAQEQFSSKEHTITTYQEQLQDYDICKESLTILDEQFKLLQDQLNKQIEKNQILEDQLQESLQQINLMSENNLLFEELHQQNEHFKSQIETLKAENYVQQQKNLDLENQILIQKQQECDSPMKLQKLQQEYSENQNEYFKFKDQAIREIHLIKQDKSYMTKELQEFKTMIDSYLLMDNDFQSPIPTIQEYYEKLVSFSEDIVSQLLTLKEQQQSNHHQLNFQETQETQTVINFDNKETFIDLYEVKEESTQTEQQQVENSLSGSMWLNNDTINSNQDQFQQMKKKNEDLDQLLKNYEKEVSNLKQHNKALQKKIDLNTKPSAQDRLGKRTSLFESGPRKSKQFHFNNLCESQQIDDNQRELLFLKDVIENLKKENQQLQNENQELSEKLQISKELQDKQLEEQSRLEDQLQSQILLNQTRNKSVDNNQTLVSQIVSSFVQLNQIELFLVVKSAKNFQFPYIEFNRKQIKFYSQGKTRIEKQIYETFTFDDIFLDVQKVRQYFSFYGKISLDQSRMFLIIGQPKTQKKFLFIMFLDLYASLIKEQKINQNLKYNVQINYSEKIGSNWNNLEQLSSNFIISTETLEQNLQQLELAIEKLKFYLYGKNQAKYLGKEKFRKIEINFITIFRDQKYQQQFIIMTIPQVQRCEFPKFVKKFCNHTPSLNFKYYCLLTVNPILLHYNPTVDIIYFAKIVYAQNNQEELNKQMKIDDESVRQVRQANGQVILKNQEIDVLKKQIESLKKQYHEVLQKQENKQQLNQQLIALLQNVIVDIKLKMSQQKNISKSPNKLNNTETQFYEKLISSLENLSRKLSPIQQNLLTDRSYSP